MEPSSKSHLTTERKTLSTSSVSQVGNGITVQADVSRAEQVEAYVKQAMDQYGRIDVFLEQCGRHPEAVPVRAHLRRRI